MRTFLKSLVTVIVVILIVWGSIRLRAIIAQQQLHTGTMTLSGNITQIEQVPNPAVGGETTWRYKMAVDGGATAYFIYVTNPALGPDDPYQKDIVPRIHTDLSVGKRITVHGYYSRTANTIEIDNGADYSVEAAK